MFFLFINIASDEENELGNEASDDLNSMSDEDDDDDDDDEDEDAIGDDSENGEVTSEPNVENSAPSNSEGMVINAHVVHHSWNFWLRKGKRLANSTDCKYVFVVVAVENEMQGEDEDEFQNLDLISEDEAEESQEETIIFKGTGKKRQ